MEFNAKIDPATLKIAVVGAGSWGTAIADLLACKGYPVELWAFEKEVKNQIEESHENKLFLPDYTLSPNLSCSNDLAGVVSDANLIVIVVPSHVMRDVTQQMSGHLLADTIVASASKGIEQKTHLTMSGVIKETLPEVNQDRLAVISGPSFAKEVAQKMPTSVTVACKSASSASLVQHVFATAGMLDGLGLGLNTRAALMTRGMTEIRRLGLQLGANPRTFTGLAGFGDLVLTCTGNLSRNYTVGIQLGRGKKLQDILSEMHMVAEGVKNAKSVYNLSRKLGVEMPICHAIYRILYEDLAPKEAVYHLMTRTLRQELDKN
jgi:glycerol-3-phosphate dehydrogenase (NAD(P)+)